MKSYIAMLGLILGAAFPGGALAEKTPDNTKDSPKTVEEKVDPIPRLAELRIDEYVVAARAINLPLPGKIRTVQNLLDRLEKWRKDDKIGAVLLDLGNVALSMADVEELRGGLLRLKEADKKVLAFLNAGTPNAYLLAAMADEIATPPTGSVMLPGLGRLFPFMKGYYQMIGIEFDVITAGRFKYPGFLNSREPNKYFEEEFNAILDSWIGDYKAMIAEGRNLSEEEVTDIVDTALFNATAAQQRGLVDVLAFYDEYRDRLLRSEKMKRYRGDDKGLANVNSIQGLMELVNEELRRSEKARKAVGPKIAVVHARGPIVDFNLGAGFSTQLICRDDFVKVINEVRRNKSIKAVVLHIDSPGGSGYASDVIWHHLERLKKSKPLVVSMGSVAGSGGYFIACPAQEIFAQPTTLTGSIGVLGIVQSARSMFNRMDYELAPMTRGARALLGAPHRELSKEDRAFIQKYMDDFYDIFIDRVAVSRKMPASEVRKIAEGRIYTGRQALELNLVDALGGLDDAIQAARRIANIPPSAELKIVHYPRPSSLGEIFESFASVGMAGVLTQLTGASQAVKPISFEDQLFLFAQRPQALCWMGIPDFYRPATLFHTLPGGFLGKAAPNPIEMMLQGSR